MKGVAIGLAAVLCACSGSMGEAGSAGPQGPAGPQGQPGTASVHFRFAVKTESFTASPGPHLAIAQCPSGTRIIGGSCTCSPAPDVHVAASSTVPSGVIQGGEFHLCECDPGAVTDWMVTAQATCVDGTGVSFE